MLVRHTLHGIPFQRKRCSSIVIIMEAPRILREGAYTTEDVHALKKESEILNDIYPLQLKELFEIQNPSKIHHEEFENEQREFCRAQEEDSETRGDWIYFPWSKTLVHSVSEDDLYQLRTNRNKKIITEDEQEKLRKTTIGLLGMSVGSNVGLNLIYAGTGSTYKLADFDTLDTTNLNRVRARLDQVGKNKLDIVAAQMYETNPYLTIEEYTKGVHEENLRSFIEGCTVVFEIIDDFKMKIRVRQIAKEVNVPVVMLTNLGDRVLIDIERYDTEKNTQLFNDRIGDVGEQILSGEVTKELEKKYALELVGVDNIPERVIDTVKSIGVDVVGRPQLMSTASVSAGIGAYVVRKIVLENITSGRYLLSLDTVFANPQ